MSCKKLSGREKISASRDFTVCIIRCVYRAELILGRYRSDGVTLSGFDSFLQITLIDIVEMLPIHHSCEHFAEFAWLKIFYFIFQRPDQSHLGCRGDFDRSVQTYEY